MGYAMGRSLRAPNCLIIEAEEAYWYNGRGLYLRYDSSLGEVMAFLNILDPLYDIRVFQRLCAVHDVGCKKRVKNEFNIKI